MTFFKEAGPISSQLSDEFRSIYLFKNSYLFTGTIVLMEFRLTIFDRIIIGQYS